MPRGEEVQFYASAPGALSRGWMSGSLAALEWEMLPVVASLMVALYPQEVEIEMERCKMDETQAQPTKTTTVEDWAKEITSYHKPDDAGVAAITNIREATANLLVAIVKNCPPGADRSAAIRKARETMMTANAAIVVPAMSI